MPPRNTGLAIPTNRENHGFNHLRVKAYEQIEGETLIAPQFSFDNEDDLLEYLKVVHDKLAATKAYILKAKELGLNPNRSGIHKESIPIALAEEPIRISMWSQQRIFLILDGDAQLRKMAMEKTDVDTELEEVMGDYWERWKEVRAALAWQLPGADAAEQEKRADDIMTQVLDKIVEM